MKEISSFKGREGEGPIEDCSTHLPAIHADAVPHFLEATGDDFSGAHAPQTSVPFGARECSGDVPCLIDLRRYNFPVNGSDAAGVPSSVLSEFDTT